MTRPEKRFPLPYSEVVKSTPGPELRKRQAIDPNPTKKSHFELPLFSPPKKETNSSTSESTPAFSAFDAARRAMVNRLREQGIKNQKILSAMSVVPRHCFLESGFASQAYIDASLPIGHQQTISQPYIVSRMIETLLERGDLNKVLEIGTGCGYQAAVLSVVAKEVYSIERIKALHELAKHNLRPMRIPNIRLQYGDGMLGIPSAAPFDAIILAAAGLAVPDALLKQLAVGGRLIAPVGEGKQELHLIERISQFEWKKHVLESCFFVPLLGGTR